MTRRWWLTCAHGTLALAVLELMAGGPLAAQIRSDDFGIDDLSDIIAREVADKGFPSFALVLVEGGGIAAEIVHGYRTWNSHEAVTPSTIYRTGSVGKTLTDLAVMAAVDRGQIDLDDDVRHTCQSSNPVPRSRNRSPCAI